MDSLPTPTNNSSRPEVDTSKSENNFLLKHNFESYSEQTHYRHHPGNNQMTSTQTRNDRLQTNFTDFANKHRQFSFTNHEGLAPIDDIGGDCLCDRESSVEHSPSPSSTPIVSDLDELLADTPNANMQHIDSSTSKCNEPSFPLPGISIPYNTSDDDESDTPEPCDTPRGSEFVHFFEEMKLSSAEDDSETLIDYEEFMDIPSPLYANASLSPTSKSWQKKTMTRMNYKRCKTIKCITPISQERAEWNLNNYDMQQTRRRSVANITPSVHKLFKLDADLLKIREEYLKRTQTKCDFDDIDDIKSEFGAKRKGNIDEIKEDETAEIRDKDLPENENKKESNCSHISIFMIGILITLGIIYYLCKKKK